MPMPKLKQKDHTPMPRPPLPVAFAPPKNPCTNARMLNYSDFWVPWKERADKVCTSWHLSWTATRSASIWEPWPASPMTSSISSHWTLFTDANQWYRQWIEGKRCGNDKLASAGWQKKQGRTDCKEHSPCSGHTNVSLVPSISRSHSRQTKKEMDFMPYRATWDPYLWLLLMDNTLSLPKLIADCPLSLFAHEFSSRSHSPSCQSRNGWLPNWQPNTGTMHAVKTVLSPSPHELCMHSATCMWWQASQAHCKLQTPGMSCMPIWEITLMSSHTWAHSDWFCTLYS